MKKRQVGIPNTSELDDDQIEALIRKLSAIKGSAPELLAALQDEANSRMANGSSSRGGGGGGSRSQQRATAAGISSSSSAAAGRTGDRHRGGGGGPIRPVYGEEEDDDDYEEEEEETESEEEDEFDEDGPCVGHGYSDEVSVISEMTTPTVVSNLNVPEEERYNEIHQGYSAITRSKKPDLLSQVNRMNAARNKQPPQRASAAAAVATNSNGEPIDPMKRKAYTSGLSAMAKISEGEPASVTKPQRKPPSSSAAGAAAGTSSKSRRAPQPPQRKNSHDGSVKNRATSTGRGLKKKPSTTKDGEEVAGSKSPRMKKKSSSNHGKTKSSGSHGSGSGSGSVERRARSSGEKGSSKDFADNWHKSLSGADFDETNMDDNGFPFSFGNEADNAFGTSKSSGWGKPSSSGSAGQTDAFDPFDAGGGFDSSFQPASTSNRGPQKKPSSGSRSSGRPARPKRETSPRRKPTR